MNKLVLVHSDLENPRDWDNLGTLALAPRYYSDESIGDFNEYLLTLLGLDIETALRSSRLESFYSEAMKDYLLGRLSKDYVWKRVYKYEHSGISFSTTPFNCRWDSGLAGIITVSKKKIREDLGIKKVTAKVVEQVEKMLASEIETYNIFVNNEGVGFRIEDEDGEILNSCYGFFKSEGWVTHVACHIDIDSLGLTTGEELIELIKNTEIKYE